MPGQVTVSWWLKKRKVEGERSVTSAPNERGGLPAFFQGDRNLRRSTSKRERDGRLLPFSVGKGRRVLSFF